MPQITKPEKIDPTKGMPEYTEKFAAGETSAAEGNTEWGINRERIPTRYQEEFRSMARKVAMRDMFARIEEVKNSAVRRFAWRNMLDVVFSEDQAVWTQIGAPQGPQLKHQEDTGDEELHYPFNIFQQFGREHIAIVAEPWKIRMEATDPSSPDALRVAQAADAMRENIEAKNELKQLRVDAARLSWTDGRVSLYSRWVTDGARFGYEEEGQEEETPEGVGEGGDPPKKKPREPKGGELITPYGVLECKVPINMRSSSDFMWRQLSYEIDLTSAKSMYPWLADSLQGGEPGPGEYNFDRTTRLAVTQGIRLITESGDTTKSLPTWQRTWFRPSFFAEIEDDDVRGWFQDNYPNGGMVAFVGDTYCESRDESMDDHWKEVHPLPGDGQATPACGEIIMPVQYAVLDMVDLAMETFMKGIPAIYCNKDMVDLQAISKQKAGPGAHYSSKQGLEPDQKMQDSFWPEPIPELSQSAMGFLEQLFTIVPQSLTGLSSAALGMASPDNQTKGGIQLLQAASKGQSGVAWGAFREGYAGSMAQCVRIGAYFRAAEAEDGKIKLGNVEIDLEDLFPGNWACKPDGDESYPNTHAERHEAIKELKADVAAMPALGQMFSAPKNLALLKDDYGLTDYEVEGASSYEKQMSELQQLLAETPVPNVQAKQAYATAVLQAAATGQPPPPPPPPEAFLQSSIQPGKYDRDEFELAALVDWFNDPEGIQAARDNPEGYMNAVLHADLHQAKVDQKQAKQQQAALLPQIALEKAKHAPAPPKSPSESIQFKDLGPSGQLQLGKQAGLDLTADVAAHITEDTLGGGQPPKPAAKPQPRPQ